mmetsp:Transcript_822/g.1801  ORF Transcript_822/g.1801 Transcript_822/m.1801 type:complete len:258 (+) Transcript_822:738-1511(+)
MTDLIGYTQRDVTNPVRRNIDRVYLRLMQKHHNLIQAFISVDGNYDGKVSIQEFSEALSSLNLLFTDYEIESMFASLDSQGKGYFNYEDFAKMKGDTKFSTTLRSGSSPPQGDPTDDLRTVTASSTRSRFYFGPKRFQKMVLPSDANPSFSYGVASQPTDNIQDVLQHNFAKEYLTKLIASQGKSVSVAPARSVKRSTVASVKRAACIREKYGLDREDTKALWKLSKFNRILPRLTGVRMEDARSTGEDPLNKSAVL